MGFRAHAIRAALCDPEARMKAVRLPSHAAVDKTLDELEQLRWPPSHVARQAQRLRAYIADLRRRAGIAS